MKSSFHSLIPFLLIILPTANFGDSIHCCNCHLFSLILVELNSRLKSHSSCLGSLLCSLWADPQITLLPLLLHVDSLLQRCVYRTVALQRSQGGPTKNAACNTSSVVAWRHSVRDAFLCCVWGRIHRERRLQHLFCCVMPYSAACVRLLAGNMFSLPPQFLLLANTPQYALPLPEGRTGTAWEPSKREI
jgi:hypothetical protein